jgi:hypothetical protein
MPEPEHKPRTMRFLAELAVVLVLGGLFARKVWHGWQGPFQPLRRADVSDLPQDQGILTSELAMPGSSVARIAAPKERMLIRKPSDEKAEQSLVTAPPIAADSLALAREEPVELKEKGWRESLTPQQALGAVFGLFVVAFLFLARLLRRGTQKGFSHD